MKLHNRWLMLVPALVSVSCGGNPAPQAAPPLPATRTAEAPAGSCLSYGGPASCPASAAGSARRDSAARAFANGLTALASGGIPRFASAHPLWDGRGVLIAILDSGVDPGIPGLGTASDGSTKVLDIRDFSGEGRVALRPAIRRGDTLLVGTHRVLGASRVAALSADAAIWGGVLAEQSLGGPPAADINGNGNIADTMVLVVARTSGGWALLTDTNGDGSLVDERPVHDYLVAHEIFGWHQRAAAVPPAYFAANIVDSAGSPALNLVFDTFGHGSHVAGIAAGHDIFGVAGFDGVAPGAKLIALKIGNDAHGAVSTTGSMVRALDHAIRFAKDRAMPLVVNLSFGVGNEVEGTARVDAMIDSILAAHPDVVMTIAAGNDGPGLSTLGFPGEAMRPISVGASVPAVFQGGASAATPEIMAAFSARGGEFAGPDVVAPGTAYSTVPGFALGNELEAGTSMATPYVAGMVARLMSGARASGLAINASSIKQSLRTSARPLPRASAVDQGAGLPDITRAWAWLSTPHDVATIAVDVGQVTGRGAVLLTATGGGRALGTRVSLRRVDSNAPLTLRLVTDASWLQIPETVTLPAGRGEFTVSVRPEAVTTPGMLQAVIRLEGPDETAGSLALIPVTVRVPIATTLSASAMVREDAGGTGRVFFAADTGRGVQIEVATLSSKDKLIAALHEPGGMPFRDDRSIAAGFDAGAGLFDLDARDVAAGLYELDVEATGLGPANAKVTVRQAPVRLGASLSRDTLRVTARNLVATPLSVRIRAGLIGGERQLTVSGSGSAPVRVAIAVPSWAARTVVDTRMPREAWSRFTDFGVSFLDRPGKQFDTNPINYSFSRATPELPDTVVGDTLIVLLTPGFADPGDRGAWTLDLSVRFYVDTPFSLDGGGEPPKPLAGNALREDRFALSTFPIAFPADFLPLITVVALEGSDHIWTREVRLLRAGTPR